MQAYHDQVMRTSMASDRSHLDDLVRVLKPEDKRAEFEVAYRILPPASNASCRRRFG
jgi:type I restriction enzyme R subunit